MDGGRRVMWAVALLAIAVRLPGISTQALWQDEVASARIITEPTLPRLLARVARTESTPPLWYALGWLAHRAGTPVPDAGPHIFHHNLETVRRLTPAVRSRATYDRSLSVLRKAKAYARTHRWSEVVDAYREEMEKVIG